MAQRFFLVVSLFFLISALSSAPAHAQYDIFSNTSSLSLSLSPAIPTTNSSVTIAAQSPFDDLRSATLTWVVNGKKILSGVGEKTITIPTGALGTKSIVGVSATLPDGSTAGSQTIIHPGEIDLLFDADSFVPPFYRGRALPSAGTTLRLQAITRFKNMDGSLIPDAAIDFKWKRGGQALMGVSGKGKSSISIPAPSLFSSDTISVEARSLDGEFSATARQPVSDTDPVVILYEDHPLFGVLYENAMGAQKNIFTSETVLAAVPFFADAFSPEDPSLQYAWRVNGASVPATSTKKSEIVIGSASTGGTASVTLDIAHAQNYFMNAHGSTVLKFTNEKAATGGLKKNLFEGN